MFLEKIQQQQNLKQLMRLTLINILNAKGVIYTYYKQQQERENNVHRQIRDCFIQQKMEQWKTK